MASRRHRTDHVSEADLKAELEQQVASKRAQKAAEKIRDKAETLSHYEHYPIGGDEFPPQLKDLEALVARQRLELESKRQSLGLQDDVPSRDREAGKHIPEHHKWRADDVYSAYTEQSTPFGLPTRPSSELLREESERDRRLRLREEERARRRYIASADDQDTSGYEIAAAGRREPPALQAYHDMPVSNRFDPHSNDPPKRSSVDTNQAQGLPLGMHEAEAKERKKKERQRDYQEFLEQKQYKDSNKRLSTADAPPPASQLRSHPSQDRDDAYRKAKDKSSSEPTEFWPFGKERQLIQKQIIEKHNEYQNQLELKAEIERRERALREVESQLKRVNAKESQGSKHQEQPPPIRQRPASARYDDSSIEPVNMSNVRVAAVPGLVGDVSEAKRLEQERKRMYALELERQMKEKEFYVKQSKALERGEQQDVSRPVSQPSGGPPPIDSRHSHQQQQQQQLQQEQQQQRVVPSQEVTEKERKMQYKMDLDRQTEERNRIRREEMERDRLKHELAMHSNHHEAERDVPDIRNNLSVHTNDMHYEPAFDSHMSIQQASHVPQSVRGPFNMGFQNHPIRTEPDLYHAYSQHQFMSEPPLASAASKPMSDHRQAPPTASVSDSPPSHHEGEGANKKKFMSALSSLHGGPTNMELEKKERQQQYKQELQRQMEEQKRLKEEEKRKRELEDMQLEMKAKLAAEEERRREALEKGHKPSRRTEEQDLPGVPRRKKVHDGADPSDHLEVDTPKSRQQGPLEVLEEAVGNGRFSKPYLDPNQRDALRKKEQEQARLKVDLARQVEEKKRLLQMQKQKEHEEESREDARLARDRELIKNRFDHEQEADDIAFRRMRGEIVESPKAVSKPILEPDLHEPYEKDRHRVQWDHETVSSHVTSKPSRREHVSSRDRDRNDRRGPSDRSSDSYRRRPDSRDGYSDSGLSQGRYDSREDMRDRDRDREEREREYSNRKSMGSAASDALPIVSDLVRQNQEIYHQLHSEIDNFRKERDEAREAVLKLKEMQLAEKEKLFQDKMQLLSGQSHQGPASVLDLERPYIPRQPSPLHTYSDAPLAYQQFNNRDGNQAMYPTISKYEDPLFMSEKPIPAPKQFAYLDSYPGIHDHRVGSSKLIPLDAYDEQEPIPRMNQHVNRRVGMSLMEQSLASDSKLVDPFLLDGTWKIGAGETLQDVIKQANNELKRGAIAEEPHDESTYHYPKDSHVRNGNDPQLRNPPVVDLTHQMNRDMGDTVKTFDVLTSSQQWDESLAAESFLLPTPTDTNVSERRIDSAVRRPQLKSLGLDSSVHPFEPSSSLSPKVSSVRPSPRRSQFNINSVVDKSLASNTKLVSMAKDSPLYKESIRGTPTESSLLSDLSVFDMSKPILEDDPMFELSQTIKPITPIASRSGKKHLFEGDLRDDRSDTSGFALSSDIALGNTVDQHSISDSSLPISRSRKLKDRIDHSIEHVSASEVGARPLSAMSQVSAGSSVNYGKYTRMAIAELKKARHTDGSVGDSLDELDKLLQSDWPSQGTTRKPSTAGARLDTRHLSVPPTDSMYSSNMSLVAPSLTSLQEGFTVDPDSSIFQS